MKIDNNKNLIKKEKSTLVRAVGEKEKQLLRILGVGVAQEYPDLTSIEQFIIVIGI